ncbi:hypothetical protein ACFYW1_04305 [Streptomyces sp. NPDC002669]
MSLPTHVDWNTWADPTVYVPLSAGPNPVRLSHESTDTGGVNLDRIVTDF